MLLINTLTLTLTLLAFFNRHYIDIRYFSADMQNDAHNFLSFRAFVRVQRSVEILDERRIIRVIKYNYESIMILSNHQRLQSEVSESRAPRVPRH